MAPAPTPALTLPEIDAKLVQVHWAWLHAIWINNEMGVKLADVEQDILLDQRFALTTAARSRSCSH